MIARIIPTRSGIQNILGLAWPIMVSMLSYTAMTVADSIYVGQLGTAPLAAIGIAAAVIHAGTAMGHGLLGGMRVQVATSTGANQPDQARIYGFQGLWLALVLGVMVAALAPLGPYVFPAMGASPEMAVQASAFYAIRTLSAPLVFGQVALSGWFQGRGNTRTPMVASVLSNVINVVVDPILIFGWGSIPAMGVEGAAIATALGLAAGLFFLLVAARRDLFTAMVWPSRAHLGAIWKIGSPTGLQHLIDVASFAWFSALLAQSGEAHLAAHVVAVRIALVSFLPGYAIGEASGVLVGQAIGAKRPQDARRANHSAMWVAVALMMAWAVVFMGMPGPVVSVFGVSSDVASIAAATLFVVGTMQVFDAIATVALGSLAGAGDTRFVLVISVIGAWFVKVPLVTVLVSRFDLGAPGAWIGITFEVLFLAVVAGWRVKGDQWLRQTEPEVLLHTATAA